MANIGNPGATSLTVRTEDVGDVTGLGIIFESSDYADRFLQQAEAFYETPRGAFKSFVIFFYDLLTHCQLVIDLATDSSAVAINIPGLDRSVLEAIEAELGRRPCFFLIACLASPDGEVLPYRADRIIFPDHIFVDDKLISGNAAGRPTLQTLLFSPQAN